MRWSILRHSIGRAARVAAMTTVLIGGVYTIVVVVFDNADANHLLSGVDAHLSDRLAEATRSDSLPYGTGNAYNAGEVEGAPVLFWSVGVKGQVVAQTPGAPQLTSFTPTAVAQPVSVRIGGTSFRLKAVRVTDGYLVAGQSLAETAHVESVLFAAELIAGPILLVGTYIATLVIGLMTSGPVEQSRRRQLEFTADASHELRTPLAVIQAEVGLALNARRDERQYHETLTKVRYESERLRHIVDDLLWLARFDSYRPSSDSEPVDLCTIADSCRDRFGAIAQGRAIEISVEHKGGSPAMIDAPPDLIDRLTGVLVDNACCYAGPGGQVRIVTLTSANSVTLSVEDSGPGIPAEDRSRLFDRFHRATEDENETGLGLAIADSVVRSTTGRWRISDSELGGAHMEVSWRRSHLSGSGGRRLHGRWSRPLTRFNHRSAPTDDSQVLISQVGTGRPR